MHDKRLNSLHLRSLRHIFGITWQEHTPNQEVVERADIPSMSALLSQRRLCRLGYGCRTEDGRIPKDVLYGELASGAEKRERRREKPSTTTLQTTASFSQGRGHCFTIQTTKGATSSRRAVYFLNRLHGRYKFTRGSYFPNIEGATSTVHKAFSTYSIVS